MTYTQIYEAVYIDSDEDVNTLRSLSPSELAAWRVAEDIWSRDIMEGVWDFVDQDTRDEMFETWVAIIETAVNK